VIKFFRLPITLLCSVLVLGAVLCGCGKKGDPRPSGIAPPKAISDLKASLADSTVVLRWSVPDAKGGIQKYRIERSEFRAKGATCPDCPLEYTVLAEIALNDPKLKKEGANMVTYVDSGIKAGYFYAYRVITCDAWGFCSEASNIGEVVVSPTTTGGKK
jgi:hypothetical protein